MLVVPHVNARPPRAINTTMSLSVVMDCDKYRLEASSDQINGQRARETGHPTGNKIERGVDICCR